MPSLIWQIAIYVIPISVVFFALGYWSRGFLLSKNTRGGKIEPFSGNPKDDSKLSQATKRDSLDRIHGVGLGTAKRLHKMGITSFSQIAQWTEAEVQTSPFRDRIINDNWQEQAREFLTAREDERDS